MNAQKWGKTGEVRLNDDGSIDEIVAQDVSVHIEQMSDGVWWMGITRPDGDVLAVDFFTPRNARIICSAESDDGRVYVGFEK